MGFEGADSIVISSEHVSAESQLRYAPYALMKGATGLRLAGATERVVNCECQGIGAPERG
jgi:hypothetical protein